MVLLKKGKWLFAAASGGIGLYFGLYSYLESEKQIADSSWTTNFEPSVKWDFNWDKRDLCSVVKPSKTPDDPEEQNRINEEKKAKTPTATRHVILIRHGQYEEKFHKDEEKILTPLGREQADLVGQRLKQLDFNYTKLITSTMTRAIETSDIILKYFPDLPIEKDDMLREGVPIPPEPPTQSWLPESDYFEDGARIEAAFRKYFHRASPSQKSTSFEIIVCHENTIRYFVCRALQFPPESWIRFSLHHCSMTCISIRPSGKVILYALGDSGFLPREAVTSKKRYLTSHTKKEKDDVKPEKKKIEVDL